jgi:putative addiction module CopG family antidote
MGMQAVQVRLSEEQLKFIERQVRAGKYPNRSEAIRDYLRKAQLWEVLERILELGDRGEESEEEIKASIDRIREKVYRKMIAPKLKRARAA